MDNETLEKMKQYKGIMQFIEDNSPAFIAAMLDSVLFAHACDLIDPRNRALPDPQEAKSELYVLHGLRDAIQEIK